MQRFEQQLDKLIDKPTVDRVEAVNEAFQELSAQDKVNAFEMIEDEREIMFEEGDEGVDNIDMLLDALEQDYEEALEEADVEGSMTRARNIISTSGVTNPGAMLSLTQPFVEQLPSTKKKKRLEKLAALSKAQGRRTGNGTTFSKVDQNGGVEDPSTVVRFGKRGGFIGAIAKPLISALAPLAVSGITSLIKKKKGSGCRSPEKIKRMIKEDEEGGFIGSLVSALIPAGVSLISSLAQKKGKGLLSEDEEEDLYLQLVPMGKKILKKQLKGMGATDMMSLIGTTGEGPSLHGGQLLTKVDQSVALPAQRQGGQLLTKVDQNGGVEDPSTVVRFGKRGGAITNSIQQHFNQLVQGVGNPETHISAIVNEISGMDDAKDTAIDIMELMDDFVAHPDKQLLKRLNKLDTRLQQFIDPTSKQGGTTFSKVDQNGRVEDPSTVLRFGKRGGFIGSLLGALVPAGVSLISSALSKKGKGPTFEKVDQNGRVEDPSTVLRFGKRGGAIIPRPGEIVESINFPRDPDPEFDMGWTDDKIRLFLDGAPGLLSKQQRMRNITDDMIIEDTPQNIRIKFSDHDIANTPHREVVGFMDENWPAIGVRFVSPTKSSSGSGPTFSKVDQNSESARQRGSQSVALPAQRQGGGISAHRTAHEVKSQREIYAQKIKDMKKVQKLANTRTRGQMGLTSVGSGIY